MKLNNYKDDVSEVNVMSLKISSCSLITALLPVMTFGVSTPV